jgi:hypothetical protein
MFHSPHESREPIIFPGGSSWLNALPLARIRGRACISFLCPAKLSCALDAE